MDCSFGLGYWLFSTCNFGVIDVGIFILCLVRFIGVSFLCLFFSLCSFLNLFILWMCCFGIMSLWYCILVIQPPPTCCCCCLCGTCLVFGAFLICFLGCCSACSFLRCSVLVVHCFCIAYWSFGMGTFHVIVLGVFIWCLVSFQSCFVAFLLVIGLFVHYLDALFWYFIFFVKCNWLGKTF